MKFQKFLNKFLSVLITTLLIIQPLSGSIATFQNIAYPTQNIDLEKVKNVAFEYIGHELYSPNSPYPQIQEYIPKTAIHSIVGGALAELAGGDFSQGAIATAVSHNVGEYLFKDLLKEVAKDNISEEYAEEIIKGVSSIISGAVVLATHENVTDKELEIAQSMGESVVENNSLKLFKAGAKALKDLKDTLVKKGKLTKDDIEESLKGTSKDEALSILEDLIELTNDDFGFNDVFAAVSIAIGLDLKSSKSKQEASEKAQQLYNKVFNKADDVAINIVRNMDDFYSLRGASFNEVEKLADQKYLTMQWNKAPLKNGEGVRYYDGKGNSFQINKGYEGSNNIHGGAYIKFTEGNQTIRIPLKGNPEL